MKLWVLAGGILLFTSVGSESSAEAPASTGLSDSQIQAVLDGAPQRRDRMLRNQLETPYPPASVGVWHYADFALAALYLNQKVPEANAAILKIRKDFPVNPNPERKKGDPEVEDFHWYINILHRIYFLFHSKSPFFPGRLSAEAEKALLEIFWDSAWRHCRKEVANPELTWQVWGSENHGAMLYSGFWGSAQILKDAPEYRNRKYEDGSSPAEMSLAWNEFFKRLALERASKGLLVEIGSTYNKYTLQGWYNMADFAEDPVLMKRMNMLLDLFWADWAIDQIDGIRGGAKHRIYPGRTSTRGSFSSGQGMAWFHFGVGRPASQHPGHACAATSFYRPLPVVVDLALDTPGRGRYAYVSRRPGLQVQPKPSGVDWAKYVLRSDDGGILRYSWCTPDFIMGTSMMEARPHTDWSAISSQNRWEGVIFAGHPDSRIFAQPYPPKRGSVYNQQWSVQKKGVAIIQKLRTHRHAHGQRVWFSSDLKTESRGGWTFARAESAFAAVRIVQGQTSWAESTKEDGAPGRWLVCQDEFTPIVLEVGEHPAFTSFKAFQDQILGNAFSHEKGTLKYRSRFYGTELTFFTASTQMPQIDGSPVNLRPEKVYDSPFIVGDWGKGIVTLRKGKREAVLDFANEED